MLRIKLFHIELWIQIGDKIKKNKDWLCTIYALDPKKRYIICLFKEKQIGYTCVEKKKVLLQNLPQ